MRSRIIMNLLTTAFLCERAYPQGPDSDVLKVNPPLEPLEPLGIDTSSLPTFLVVATGPVPQITASIALPTGSVTLLGAEPDTDSSSTETIQEDAEEVTEITTTLLTLPMGALPPALSQPPYLYP